MPEDTQLLLRVYTPHPGWALTVMISFLAHTFYCILVDKMENAT